MIRLVCLALTVLLVPLSSRSATVLSDDFEDGILDAALWSAPYGGVVEANGTCHLTERRFLTTVQQFDPTALPVEISCRFRWETAGDSFVIAVRSDGLREGSFERVLNGIAFGIQSYGNGLVMIERVLNDVGTILYQGSFPYLESVGAWHTARVVDDGTSVSCYLDGALVATVEDQTAFDVHHVSFYNREHAALTMEVDDVRIDLLGTVATAPGSWADVKAGFR